MQTSFSGKLALIALASSLGIAIAAFRVLNTWLATRRLVSGWLNSAERITIDDVSVPAYAIEHPFPVIAVVGIFRPRIFIAEKVLDSLNPQEFRASIAHECGHLAAFDNLKRTVLRVCRDVLVFPIGKRLDRAWTDNAETVADEYAANKGRTTALDLASALVKIARIVPANATPAMPSGTFLLEEHNADVTSRVRRLVRLSEDRVPAVRSGLLGISPSPGCGPPDLSLL
jgi:Zn-dependent protease with chaperone function